jgi:hypothetical protein
MKEGTISMALFILLLNQLILLFPQKLSYGTHIWRLDDLFKYFEGKLSRMTRSLHQISLYQIDLVFIVVLQSLFADPLKLLFIGGDMLRIGEL